MRAAAGLFLFAGVCAAQPLDFGIELQTVLEHDDRAFLWFHPRACAAPGGAPVIVLTLQKHLHVSDYYSGLHVMYSRDGGRSWTPPDPRPELAWRDEGGGITEAVCDVTPGWHDGTKRVIAIGVKVRYRDGAQVMDAPQSHAVAYAVFDPAAETWTPWRFVEMPDPAGKFFIVAPGCTQWTVEENGEILLPVYFRAADAQTHLSTVLHCSFDGTTLRYLAHGDELALEVERGLVEPSLTKFRGRYFLTLRNDLKGYVTSGDDGLHFAPIRPWTFDDGEELGSYNTQQHWLTHSGGLFLVYTRRGANNDHVFRHRAPLFVARVDPDRLVVLRDTERMLIPERGATLGNFGVCHVSPEESWVTVSEGIWNDDARARGATGATYIARVHWSTPNGLAAGLPGR